MMTEQLQKKKQKNGKDLTKEELGTWTKKTGVKFSIKEPSKQLEKALAALDLDFAKLQTKVDAVFTIGRKEDYNDREIGNMIRERMKEHYGATTIWKIFENYPDARQQQNHKKVSESETFSQEKQLDNAKIDEIDKKYVGKFKELVANEQEPEPVYQMNPAEYRSEDIEQYDKPFLCEVIRYLEKRLGI